jgi:membrane protein DedA with SNARE-associated domain
MAHDGHLELVAVGAWITAGTWLADILLYYLGRWRGDWVRRRWPTLRVFMLRVFKVVRRHPWRCSLAVRWAYGLRLTLPLACGAARMPFWLYVKRYEWSLSIGLIVAVAVAFYLMRKREVREDVVDALERERRARRPGRRRDRTKR